VLVLLVVMGLLVAAPASADGAGIGASYFVHRGNLALTATWSHQITEGAINLSATGLASSDGWMGAGADVPVSDVLDPLAQLGKWKWSSGFEAAAHNVNFGIAAMTDSIKMHNWDYGAYIRLTSKVSW
jgi:hypothetical protein